MLVLSRRTNEEVYIDGSIRVVVLGIQGNRVRLGISAPDDVTVMRGEVELALDPLHASEWRSSSPELALVHA